MEDQTLVEIPTTPLADAFYPLSLREKERALLAQRRPVVGMPPLSGPLPVPAKLDDRIGLALSGGGIRSATFSLGLIQGLAEGDFLRKIDFLSTVSGGGYIGCFLGKLFNKLGDPGKVAEALKNPESESLDWLRQHGRYLSPKGLFDNFLFIAVILRNWIAVYSVYLLFGLFLAQSVMICNYRLSGWVDSAWIKLDPDNFPFGKFLILPITFLLVWAFPTAWGYWLCQGEGKKPFPSLPIFTSLAIWVAAWFCFFGLKGIPIGVDVVALSLFIGASMSFFFLIAFGLWVKNSSGEDDRYAERLRNLFTQWFWCGLLLVSFTLLLGVSDYSGGYFSRYLGKINDFRLGLPSLLASGLAFIGNKLNDMVKTKDSEKPGPWLMVGAGAVAVCWFLTLALTVSVLVHWIAQTWIGDSGRPFDRTHLLFVWVVLLLLCVCLGNTIAFLNFSSQHPFYRSRLVNAYLGAADAMDGKKKDSGTDIYGDDISMEDYRPHESGGPLHLITTTINETVSGKSNTEQQDRKGLPLVIGPCGLTVSRRHHALWLKNGEGKPRFDFLVPILVRKPDDTFAFHVFDPEKLGILGKVKAQILSYAVKKKPKGGSQTDVQEVNILSGSPHPVEPLPLGAWMAVSGAAFGTGLGANTNPFISLLLGLSNIRLGYWWNSNNEITLQQKRDLKGFRGFMEGITAKVQDFFPVQMGLADELFARFHGTARKRWYLSDGGHFENTGCYELIRRRVPLIILCDNGQDPSYQFGDFANLVLLARNDFQTEIVFLDKIQLGKGLSPELMEVIGGPEEFDVPPDANGLRQFKKQALLAWVTYPDDTHSLIVVVKPSIKGDEPADVLYYQKKNNEFPQETTLNQFYGEAEWEGYRKLGQHIVGKLLSVASSTDKWTLHDGPDLTKLEKTLAT